MKTSSALAQFPRRTGLGLSSRFWSPFLESLPAGSKKKGQFVAFQDHVCGAFACSRALLRFCNFEQFLRAGAWILFGLVASLFRDARPSRPTVPAAAYIANLSKQQQAM